MKAQRSVLVDELRGKAGNVVAQSPTGRIVVKPHQSRPRDPRSGNQQLVRASFKYLALVWARLRDQAVAAWVAEAARGRDLPHNLFLKLNWQAQYAAAFDLLTPDNPDVHPIAENDVINITSSAARLRWGAGQATGAHYVWLATYKRAQPTTPAAVSIAQAYPDHVPIGHKLVSNYYYDTTGLDAETDYRSHLFVQNPTTEGFSLSKTLDFTTTA